MNKPQLEIPVLHIPVHPKTMDGRDPTLLRGDAISGDRYYSAEFANAEWEHIWTKVWHVAGRLVELEEPGDFVAHDPMGQSVISAKQEDGSIRAFSAVCQHCALRLVEERSSVKDFHCRYQGLEWGFDDYYLADQESRVRYSHEVLNDYLAGRKGG